MTEDPEDLFAPFVRDGMTVLEPGPGMGFFTAAAAWLGRRAASLQSIFRQEMLDGLRRRAARAGQLPTASIRGWRIRTA